MSEGSITKVLLTAKSTPTGLIGTDQTIAETCYSYLVVLHPRGTKASPGTYSTPNKVTKLPTLLLTLQLPNLSVRRRPDLPICLGVAKRMVARPLPNARRERYDIL